MIEMEYIGKFGAQQIHLFHSVNMMKPMAKIILGRRKYVPMHVLGKVMQCFMLGPFPK